MRLVGRHDVVLLGGLAVALFVVFSRALERLLDVVRDLDDARGLRLLPGLIILASVFVFHQLRKRSEARAEVRTAASAAALATERAAEMERLVAFGQALGRSLDDESIHAAAAEHIPRLAPARRAWVLTLRAGQWQPFVTIGDPPPAGIEAAARSALGGGDSLASPDAADTCFPMVVAGTPMGVLGVGSAPPVGEHLRSVLTAAAAMLAGSLKNAELFREVRENSVRDSLTGCFTRTHALEVINAELRRARRSQLPLSLLMFDLDHFKLVNDRYGHLAGDAVLAEVGARMRTVLRGSDLKCRYGGEEFLVLLPDTPLAGARLVADNLRKALEANPARWNDQAIAFTASVGLTGITPGELDPLAALARADAALYRAKENGRNCVHVADELAA